MNFSSQNKDIVLVLVRGGLKPSMENFFKVNGYELKAGEDYNPADNVKVIIIDDHKEDWATISDIYMTDAKGISIISTTPVKEMKRFLAVGGKAVVTNDYYSDKLGQIFFKRLFKGEISLHMDEVFGGNFLKYKNLKIMNHTRSGHYTDIIAAEALEQEYNNVAIRGFLYNTIYYLSYLQQSGLAELPFDLEYAQNNKYFVVQIVASVKNFFLEYIVESFGNSNSSNPISYILKDNFHLAHAFDMTYTEKSNAIIITAIWEKKAELENSFSSFTFSNIRNAKQIILEVEQKIELAMAMDFSPAVEEVVKAKPLPGNKIQPTELPFGEGGIEASAEAPQEQVDGDVTITGSNPVSEDGTRIKGVTQQFNEDGTLVKGSRDDEEGKTLVRGQELNGDEDKVIVKGQELNTDQDKIIVKGNETVEEEQKTIVKGAEQKDDNFKTIITGSNEVDKSQSVIKGEGKTYTEAILLEKLKRKEDQIKQMSSTMAYLKGQVEALQAANNKARVISGNSGQLSDSDQDEINKKKEYQINEEETQEILRNMKSAKEAEALKKLAEREKELVEIAKHNELTLKKKEMEFHAKEVAFSRELEKLERGMKGKELILSKTKESVKNLIEKKDAELQSITERLQAATLKMNSTAPDPRIEEMKKENADLAFQVSDLKKKINIANNAANNTVDVKEFNEEVTRLKSEHQRTVNEKQQATAQVTAMKKETGILKDKIKEMEQMLAKANKEGLYGDKLPPKATGGDDLSKLRLEVQRANNEKDNLKASFDKAVAEATALRQEVAEAKKKLREAESKVTALPTAAPGPAPEKSVLADLERANAEFSKMVKERDMKINAISEKLTEAESKLSNIMKENEKLSKGVEEATKGKVAQLSEANKKLTADLAKAQNAAVESKKEITKAKSEITGLQNKYDKLKTDYEKATGKKAA